MAPLSLHEASSNNAMSGAEIARVTTTSQGVSGSYDSVSGAFFARLPVVPAGSSVTSFFTLSGNLVFNNGLLSSISTLALDFEDNGLGSRLVDTTLGFNPGYVCCGDDGNDPNSFMAGSGVNMIITLWGANGFTTFGGRYPNANLGMDLRLEMSPVPLPPAVWLFGSALVGLVGVARRNRGRVFRV